MVFNSAYAAASSPVAGSPLLPPAIFAAYLLISGILTFFLYLVIAKNRSRKKSFTHIFITALLLAQAILLIMSGSVAAAYLLPTPHETHTRVADAITITFDRPVSRAVMEKTITPTVPGIWTFENPVYTTHWYRQVTFHPTLSAYDPNTTYVITLGHVTNVLKTSPEQTISFTFTTAPS